MSAFRITKDEQAKTINTSIKGFFGPWSRKLVNWLNPCCPFQVDKFTAEEATEFATTDFDGGIIYVTDTDATFTSVGFWGIEAGTPIKL